MKRGGPIPRRTPLARGRWNRTEASPEAVAVVERAFAGRATWLRNRSNRTRWARLRTKVFTRDGGRCVACGVVLHAAAWECHHRQLRSQGGPDELFNLVALCSTSHAWAHSYRLESEPLGFIVPSHGDPATVPVVRFDGVVYLLTEEEAA